MHPAVEAYNKRRSDRKAVAAYKARRQARLDGGPGSGNFGHEGRTGQIGGSAESTRITDTMRSARSDVSIRKPTSDEVQKARSSLGLGAFGDIQAKYIDELNRAYDNNDKAAIAEINKKCQKEYDAVKENVYKSLPSYMDEGYYVVANNVDDDTAEVFSRKGFDSDSGSFMLRGVASANPKDDVESIYLANDYVKITEDEAKVRFATGLAKRNDEGTFGGVSREEEKALSIYTYATAVNSSLRKGEKNETADKIKGLIDRTFSPERTVFRGISAGSFANDIANKNVGDTIEDKGFMSTSFEESVANSHAGDNGCVLEIKVPAGYGKGISISSYSLKPEEAEVLLNAGSSLRIVSKDSDKIVCEMLSQSRNDADDPKGWIIVIGNHIPLDAEGNVIGCQPEQVKKRQADPKAVAEYKKRRQERLDGGPGSGNFGHGGRPGEVGGSTKGLSQAETDSISFWKTGNNGRGYVDIRAILNGREAPSVEKQKSLGNVQHAEDLKTQLNKIASEFESAVAKCPSANGDELIRITGSYNVPGLGKPELGAEFNLGKYESFSATEGDARESLIDKFGGEGQVVLRIKGTTDFKNINKMVDDTVETAGERECVNDKELRCKVTGIENVNYGGEKSSFSDDMVGGVNVVMVDIEPVSNNDSRMDDEPKAWITINGTHVPLNENGELMGAVGEKIRGEKSASSAPKVTRTPAQDKALKKIIKRTANLKNEQYRIVDKDGNVVLEKKGDRHSVAATVGEKREYLSGNIDIHNHPDGGTFSPDDLNSFGYGATEIVIATPEGTYSLKNLRVGEPDQYEGWYAMRDKIMAEVPTDVSFTQLQKTAQENLKDCEERTKMSEINEQYMKMHDNGASREELNEFYQNSGYEDLNASYKVKLAAERRRLETEPNDTFFKEHAAEYGFEYTFEPSSRNDSLDADRAIHLYEEIKKRHEGRKAVKAYKERRKTRMDEEEPDKWVTINGTHVPLDENGVAIGGGALKGKEFKEAVSQKREPKAASRPGRFPKAKSAELQSKMQKKLDEALGGDGSKDDKYDGIRDVIKNCEVGSTFRIGTREFTKMVDTDDETAFSLAIGNSDFANTTFQDAVHLLWYEYNDENDPPEFIDREAKRSDVEQRMNQLRSEGKISGSDEIAEFEKGYINKNSPNFGKPGEYVMYRTGTLGKSGMLFFAPDKAGADTYASLHDGNTSQYTIELKNPLVITGDGDVECVMKAWEALHPGQKAKSPQGKQWVTMDKQNATALNKSEYDSIIYMIGNEPHEIQVPAKRSKEIEKQATYSVRKWGRIGNNIESALYKGYFDEDPEDFVRIDSRMDGLEDGPTFEELYYAKKAKRLDDNAAIKAYKERKDQRRQKRLDAKAVDEYRKRRSERLENHIDNGIGSATITMRDNSRMDYGVLGMRWGHHKEKEESNSSGRKGASVSEATRSRNKGLLSSSLSDQAKANMESAKKFPEGSEERRIYEMYGAVFSQPLSGRPSAEASAEMTEKFLGDISSKLEPAAVERYKKDLANEPQITSDICDIAEQLGTGMFGLDFRLKKASDSSDGSCRIADKIAEDMDAQGWSYEHAVGNLSDLVRYTQACTPDNLVDNFNATKTALEEKGYEFVKVKNTWNSHSEKNPYRGVNCAVVSPTGTTFELQFQTPESLTCKEVNHVQYEEQRNPNTPADRKLELGRVMLSRSVEMAAPQGIESIESFDKRKKT